MKIIKTYINVLCRFRCDVILSYKDVFQQEFAVRLKNCILANYSATLNDFQIMTAEVDGCSCQIDPCVTCVGIESEKL